jgi:hypothetical protein
MHDLQTSSKEMFGRIRRIFIINGTVVMFCIDLFAEMEDFEFTTSTYAYTYSNNQTGSSGEEINSAFICV